MKTHLALLVLLLVMAGGPVSCVRQVRPARKPIVDEFSRLIQQIQKDRGSVRKLDDIAVGKTGFFYILDKRGKVVYHPEKVLIGKDFGRFAFIQEVLSAKKGCLIYGVGPRERVLFFRPINLSEILCLSIESSEVLGPLDDCTISDFSSSR